VRAASAACPVTPAEIRGPFPADGVGGRDRAINVLATSDVLREDIRTSFAGLRGTAPGVPMRVELQVADPRADCAALGGRAVYLWQCDARGDYSLYNRTDVNWLRGLQPADDLGRVRFSSIVPGCYGGRAPHLHFEVFESIDAALGGEAALLVSQLGLPEEPCEAVYADRATYGESAGNLERWPPSRDWAFRGEDRQMLMLDMSGDQAGGYLARATVGLAA
jgi:protocatechuate 3,4-dioxygenase beta subunit